MNLHALFSSLTGLFFTIITTCAQEPAIYSPQQMQADLKKFRYALEYAHPDLYAHISNPEFEELFGSLYKQTNKPLDAVMYHNLVLQLISGLHDGHSTVFAINKLRTYIYSQKILPFHCLVQNQRIFLSRNLSTQQITDGSEILAINGISSDKIIAGLQNHFGGDGLCSSCLEYRFGSSYHSLYRVFPLIFGFHSAYTLTIRDLNTKKISNVEVAGIYDDKFRESEKSKYGNNLHPAGIEEMFAKPPLSVQSNSQKSYAVLKITRFFNDDFDEPVNLYPDLIAKAFKQIKENKFKNLIIDLRANGGGIGNNAAHLLTYLTSGAFTATKEISLRGNDAYFAQITKDSLSLDKYFRLQENSEHRYLVTDSVHIPELKTFFPVKENHFDGNLFVLIDGGTLSAAAMAAGLLRELTNAVFIGTETGGHAGMSNGIRQISISGDSTDVVINFPLLHSAFGVNSNTKMRGVTPDFQVTSSIRDIIAGRDAMLEFAISRIEDSAQK